MHHSPIPVTFRIFVKWGEHDGKDHVNIVTDQVAKVLVVPEVQSTFGNLDQVQPQANGTMYEGYTWKCGLATDLASCVNKGSCTLANS